MTYEIVQKRTLAAFTAAALATAPLAAALASEHSSSEERDKYSMSMKAELSKIRDRVQAVEGDSQLEQAWDEVTGDWGRLQLATADEWEDAKAEFTESWEALVTELEEAEM